MSLSRLLRLVLVVAVLALPISAAQAAWELTTADTKLVVDVQGDRERIIQLGEIQGRHNWIAQAVPVPLMARVKLGERESELAWRFRGGDFDAKTGILTLRFTSDEPKLVLRSLWRAQAGPGPVEHWCEIENHSGQRVMITNQESLVLAGLKADAAAEIGWIKRGGGNASTQGGSFVQPLDAQLDLHLESNCDDGASPMPYLSVQVGQEHGLYVGWEFSALGSVQAKAAEGYFTLRLGNPADFRTDIEPGEVFLVPAAFVGCYRGDRDAGSYRLHRFVLEKLRPAVPKEVPDPILAYNLYLDAGGASAKEADVLRSAEVCRDTGFEAFMPDAMWFPETGDWRWDTARFPQGVTPIEAMVHNAGMRLALWCAWTNGGISTTPGALSVRGPVGHPDWFNADFQDDWQPGPFYGGQICLASPEAKQWALDKTQWLVGHHKLDYLKHDCGPISNHCNKSNHRHHYGVDASYWATMAYYEVQEKLRQAYPHVLLENCSGGGTIKDFGILRRTHYTVTTDTLSNLPDRQSIYDSTWAMPPLVLQAYTYDNAYPVKGDTPGPFLWRSGMMSAWQIDPTDTPTWGSAECDTVRRSTEIYKEWIRPILQDCQVHHILPRPDGVQWDGMFYWSDRLARGTLYIFRPESDQAEKTVKLKGLDPQKTYWVWGEDGSVSPGEHRGEELMNTGLTIHLPLPYSCDLVYVQDAAQGEPKNLHAPDAFSLGEAQISLPDPFSARVELTWSSSPWARSYHVILATTPDCSEPLAELATISPSVSLSRLPLERTYYWKVEALGFGGRRWNSGQAGQFTTPKATGFPGVAFASDLPWLSATAGFDNRVQRDANRAGRLVAIAARPYRKAICTHSFNDTTPADVVVDATGKPWATFVADVGLDDAGGGAVQFQVLVDGQIKAETPVLVHGTVHPLKVDVRGAKTITLRVLNGGDGYAGDHAAWGFPRFLDEGVADPLQ